MKMVIDADLIITIDQSLDFFQIDVHKILVSIIYYFNLCLLYSVVKLI